MNSSHIKSPCVENDKRFIDAVKLFNSKKWYESHDLFEELWHELLGNERTTIQAILQIAVAELHLERGNIKGATILYGEALGRMQGPNVVDLGKDINSLCAITKLRLINLQNNKHPEQSNSPLIIDKD